jgi:two-component system NtrC family response regulator
MSATILLIEDNGDAARFIAETLRHVPEGFVVATAGSARAGYQHLAAHPVDCVLLDYRLPDADGLECLARIRRRYPDLPVVLVTGAGSEEVAVEAMKLGATDYVVKHGRYFDTVPIVVREALGRRELRRAAAQHDGAHCPRGGGERLSRELRERYRMDGIVGDSEAIERVLVLVEQAAHAGVTVLLEGETGTGKELFAHAIHEHGPRARGPFLAQNCAALPETLLESELFGHARGAFTGADRSRRGLFEEAEGGTLFLDEMSETSLGLQAKLLRVLQDGEVRPVGHNGIRRVDVRVVAATNRNLAEAVAEGSFRRDLYYRLRVFPIRLPPLRERREDIAQLATYFLERLSAHEGRPLPGLGASALRLLERYPWPGNVRELQNEVHRLVLCLGAHERIEPDLLAPWIAEGVPSAAQHGSRPLKEIVREVELATIRARLREYGYRRGETARSLGFSRESLWAKMRRLGLRPPRRGNGDE